MPHFRWADELVAAIGFQGIDLALGRGVRAAELLGEARHAKALERRSLLCRVLLKRSLSATSLETTKRKPFDVLAEGPILDQSRTSPSVFEPVPLEFLAWFLDPSLQRNVIDELMADWVAGTLDDGRFEALPERD